jgi:hypothetical protein
MESETRANQTGRPVPGVPQSGALTPSAAPGVDTQNKCSVVVVYEEAAARQRAVDFCDLLVERFWAKCGFQLTWWPFELLEQRPSAVEAAEKARDADLIVFAADPEGELPISIRAWMESWVSRRGEREGALVAVLCPQTGSNLEAANRHIYLRTIAHRAGMDYLTEMPSNLFRCMPDSLESFAERACQVTSVLDEILHQQPKPQLLK